MAFLANREQRARAIRLGVWIAVQPALLYSLGSILLSRATHPRHHASPRMAEGGGALSAGTDYTIGAYSPIDTSWALITRQTESAGIQGPEHAVDRATAVWLATAGTVELLGESDRLGGIEPGHLADLVALRSDPLV